MKKQICLVPKLSGLGGMVSFQAKLIQGMQARNIAYTFDLRDQNNTAILVIGGTRQIINLLLAKSRKVPIIQRLNGMNWMHKVEKTPLRAYLKAEINNRTLAFLRRRAANRIIYQSEFSRDWWNLEFGKQNTPHQVIYNGVDLDVYSPLGPETPPQDHFRILIVEGHLSGANARGLHTALRLAQALKAKSDLPIELMVVADVSDAVKAEAHLAAPDLWINWRGVVPREAIPGIDRAAHVLFSTDLNAACPNSVIEALACGLPVVAYDTGALAELVQDGAGKVVPYGSNHWQLEDPVIEPLAEAALAILHDNQHFRQHARERAVTSFGLDVMVDAYLDALEQ